MAESELEELKARVERLESHLDWSKHAIKRMAELGSLHTFALGLAFKKIAQTGDLRDDDISEWKRRLEGHVDERVAWYEENFGDEEDPAAGLRAECNEAIRQLFLVIDRHP
ncbi:hypothetical protein J7444_07980 [Labrenzia sp. R4_1]|uniref:hypothetical protein n=1 Tax=Labrenzia sp. R4_1 TaxID=2821106 RepID=UPI001AD958A2|nr:hypothetical protein [Labrenzia sp. R4_1]MBO9424655.1 hypothetical protein [Labrenzia sp. R4_1]